MKHKLRKNTTPDGYMAEGISTTTKRCKGRTLAQRMWTTDRDINRKLYNQVMDVEHKIWEAAKEATALGVPFQRFCEFCESAMCAVGLGKFYFSDIHADCWMGEELDPENPDDFARLRAEYVRQSFPQFCHGPEIEKSALSSAKEQTL